jgi:Ca-activated chloride channel family protein
MKRHIWSLTILLLVVQALLLVPSTWSEGYVPEPASAVLSLSARLSQSKVLQGGDGRVTLCLGLTAPAWPDAQPQALPVDLVLVLDRSGSMSGPKIEYARRAAAALLAHLGTQDRLAVVAYADGVEHLSGLVPVSEPFRARCRQALDAMQPGGATNLGAGLKAGLDLLYAARRRTAAARLVLISDGLANRGVTDPLALGQMASLAREGGFTVSTVGVGDEFNETLMAAIADRGAGRYTWLENPEAFADVFLAELQRVRTTVFADLSVRVTLSAGMQVVDAGGYPVTMQGSQARFHPQGLRPGERRTLYVTLQVPTAGLRSFQVGDIEVSYRLGGHPHRTAFPAALSVACVPDDEAVLGAIDRQSWEQKVLDDDFNRLREEVAADLRAGQQAKAKERIVQYRQQTGQLNARIASPAVTANLEGEARRLESTVDAALAPAAAGAPAPDRNAAKRIQFEGYSNRRAAP